ncbi:hypothetical protein HAX54_049898 [Datura stramonium]|uniref:Uncharacterized protein n=1 Tax=Datura stramonium TaxID=4076 RepID=A0ABS8SX96_DATST|nr:hypothetical protein [Datura stramonium]
MDKFTVLERNRRSLGSNQSCREIPFQTYENSSKNRKLWSDQAEKEKEEGEVDVYRDEVLLENHCPLNDQAQLTQEPETITTGVKDVGMANELSPKLVTRKGEEQMKNKTTSQVDSAHPKAIDDSGKDEIKDSNCILGVRQMKVDGRAVRQQCNFMKTMEAPVITSKKSIRYHMKQLIAQNTALPVVAQGTKSVGEVKEFTGINWDEESIAKKF